ncbi:hypothetical protein PPACK8108_LOCUS24539 [Phakopsora pachyrhizi]|uniref:Secreted protein n=1 Tax=Phakopsora pachyrhizi TaxID=170000 RepID=A0AAV0BQT1_PHAPC|nr:hypothetical protein PPACK8108_LOCUS24539 [Phakopsora pachyrhizi]
MSSCTLLSCIVYSFIAVPGFNSLPDSAVPSCISESSVDARVVVESELGSGASEGNKVKPELAASSIFSVSCPWVADKVPSSGKFLVAVVEDLVLCSEMDRFSCANFACLSFSMISSFAFFFGPWNK